MTVTVDPAEPVAGLPGQVRDAALLAELRAQDVEVDAPRSISAHPGLPLTLAAR